jgi:hypothetical protein
VSGQPAAFSLTEALKRLGPVVAFYPSVAKIVGIKEAIMLAQLVYWTPRARNEEGWIYKSAEEMEAETSLTYREQKRVRESLRDQGLIEDRYNREEHLVYFRVIREAVDRLMPGQGAYDRSSDGHSTDRRMASDQSSGGTRPKVVSYKEAEITSETTQRENMSAARSTELLDGILFATWWESYPRKIDKPGCQRLWMALPVLDRAAAFEGLELWSNSAEWQEKQFIPHPANFLKRRQWESKPVEEANGDNRRNRKAGAAVPATPGKYDHLRPEQLS